VDPIVLDEMLPFFTKHFGNAASIDHRYGSEAAEAIEKSRKTIAKCINALPDDILFTSGATESNNIVIQGLSKNPSKNHVVTCVTEHKSVLDTCKHLESIGKKVTYVPVDYQGVIDLDALEKAISEKTALITVMTANNEIGTLAPVEEIGRIAHEHGIPFHTDAAQAAGHIPLDIDKLNIDLMSISAHKIYGPKGVGALYLKRSNLAAKPDPLFFGGDHESGIRSGTTNVPGIVGLASALELAVRTMDKENLLYKDWFNYIFEIFQQESDPVELNGHPFRRLPHNLNVSFENVQNKALIQAVSEKLAISSGSACTTLNVEPSHVILALGFGPERAHTAIRLGLSRFNTNEEIHFAAKLISETVGKLRKISF
jgi:cysteine desulfurase